MVISWALFKEGNRLKCHQLLSFVLTAIGTTSPLAFRTTSPFGILYKPIYLFHTNRLKRRLVVYFEIYRLFFINSAENIKKTTFPLSLLCISKKITTFATKLSCNCNSGNAISPIRKLSKNLQWIKIFPQLVTLYKANAYR